ncbi:UBX domain protein Ubx2 [Tieghemiomyces parasiticus]|uniref:UBX domain protein Ubx2 n=1 Tax=Tieghemiomyces parasiticus TaxID=78921 RepID=A0A9W7ZVV9_9FUNG|nr:UBX domain protein Ubx2 [Tieghemiomyces parasiticus]
MSSIVDTDALLQFIQVTNADPPIAHDYLEFAKGDVELAISLFLGNDGAPLNTGSTASGGHHSPPSPSLTRSIDHTAQDDIRAPLAPRREVLVDTPAPYAPFAPSSVYSPVASVAPEAPRRSIFDQLPRAPRAQEAFRDFAAESSALEGGATSEASKVNRLADLFRPPFDLIQNLPLDQARAAARSESKWVMINLQKVSEFACQVLNRDIWSNELVKPIIQQNFVFLQFANDSDEGTRYTSFYPVLRYPHVAILDPRTGERVKEWSHITNPADFVEELTEFLDLRAWKQGSAAKRPRRPEPTERTPADMTEDEQLAAAIAASMQGTSSTEEADQPPPVPSSSFSASSKPTERPDEETEMRETATPDHYSDSEDQDVSETNQRDGAYHAIPADEGTEPPADPTTTTRVQFRLPDGSRVVRRFRKDDPVRTLVSFVKARVPQAAEEAISIMYHRENLLEKLDQTVTEAGLLNASVTVGA